MARDRSPGLDELMIVNPGGMATLPGLKEKLHFPLYDAFVLPDSERSLGEVIGPEQRLRFFVDVQNKTRLETNLQVAGRLPHDNSFEARALRVVVSPPGWRVMLRECSREILEEAFQALRPNNRWSRPNKLIAESFGEALEHQLATIQADAATALAEIIYNSVTSLIVGEKVMIEMPTFWFPAGAGVSPGKGAVANHGEPDPLATFRFAEPVFIEPQQNFRAEIAFPQGFSEALAALTGPLRLWVVLDGYLIRDVQ
jgi:hypothetical protein